MEEFFKNNPNIFNNNNQSNPCRQMHKTKSQNYINIKNNNDNNYPPFIVAKFGKKKVISQDLALF